GEREMLERQVEKLTPFREFAEKIYPLSKLLCTKTQAQQVLARYQALLPRDSAYRLHCLRFLCYLELPKLLEGET
ncbi:MAG TPA: hypothetical protein VEA37_06515, partial [Flavobacterium sp.]|nr:hypothetical protein [Flavobacterium sp.]